MEVLEATDEEITLALINEHKRTLSIAKLKKSMAAIMRRRLIQIPINDTKDPNSDPLALDDGTSNGHGSVVNQQERNGIEIHLKELNSFKTKPKTGAERTRIYRNKLSEEQKAEKRERDRLRYSSKREAGMLKSINDLNSRDQREKRKKWVEAQKRYREKRKTLEPLYKVEMLSKPELSKTSSSTESLEPQFKVKKEPLYKVVNLCKPVSSKKGNSTDRSRRWRDRLSDERKAEQREQDRLRYLRKRDAGMIKSINDLSFQERREKREQWTEAQRKYREKKKALTSLTQVKSFCKSDPVYNRTSTERSRLCRERLSEEAKAENREKDRLRHRSAREAGIIKSINDLGSPERKEQRQQWMEAKRKYREKKKALGQVVHMNSPDSDNIAIPSTPVRAPAEKKKNREQLKIYRDLQKAQKEIQRLKSQRDEYKKQLLFFKNKTK